MRAAFSYLILFFTTNLFCQDIIIKKDSTRIDVKLLEVSPAEIKYKLFNYQDGPDVIINKSDIAYVIYSNGVKEIISKSETNNSFEYHKPIVWQGDSSISKKKNELKVGDYIKFNLQLGIVAQSLSSNYIRRKPEAQNTSSEEYTPSNNKYVFNYNIGFNFLFGRSPYIKHVIGINYLRSTGEYNRRFGGFGSSNIYGGGGYSSYLEDYNYVSKIHFINIVTGLRFKVYKNLYIEPLASLNITAHSDVRFSGYSSTKYISGGPTPSVYNEEIEKHKNEKVNSEHTNIHSTVSLCPKISYDFHIKNQTIGTYISYNLAYKFRLPWIMAGITYYPFKKLRANIEDEQPNQNAISKKKRKLISGLNLTIDAAATFNRAFTNTHEKYSGIKPSDPKIYKAGYGIGINIYHGKTNYFKHYVSAYLIQSQADLLKKSYTYIYENNMERSEIINTTLYKSSVDFINFGTGIRFIAFKHLYIDNGVALSLPIYSKNTIEHSETINYYYTNSSTPFNSITSSVEKSNSNSLFTEKKNWLFTAKIGYDFKIKQSKVGLFIGWNYGWANNAHWHLIGITYYPFKKLR